MFIVGFQGRLTQTWIRRWASTVATVGIRCGRNYVGCWICWHRRSHTVVSMLRSPPRCPSDHTMPNRELDSPNHLQGKCKDKLIMASNNRITYRRHPRVSECWLNHFPLAGQLIEAELNVGGSVQRRPEYVFPRCSQFLQSAIAVNMENDQIFLFPQKI